MDARTWLLFGGLTLAAMVATLALASPSRGATPAAGETRRLEILLDVQNLPEHDREAAQDRLQAIDEALATGIPLFRSFDSRETLRETLAILAEHGVDLGSTAVVNFDGIEAEVPRSALGAIRNLPFVTSVRRPVVPQPAGMADSEGLEMIGSDLANAAGATGAGITVAVIDRDWDVLSETIAIGDLPAIPTANQFEQQSSGSTNFVSRSINNAGTREHGTAATEVVHEVAPDASFRLYAVKSIAGIQAAIVLAANSGAKVILVPLTHFQTMSDPNTPGNVFRDDIDQATVTGATVVVAAGNEGTRHWSGPFKQCLDCNNSPAGLCNEAKNDTKFHLFTDEFGDEQPLNILIPDEDHYDQEVFDVTCVSAIAPGITNCPGTNCPYKMQLWEYEEDFDSDFGEPICPNDSGGLMNMVKSVGLGESFTHPFDLFTNDEDENERFYYLAVEYTGAGTPGTPNFRVACLNALGYFDLEPGFLINTPPGSLSDLAVVPNALTVGEYDSVFEEMSATSSRGSTEAPSIQKPDIVAPGIVSNWAVAEAGFVADGTFNGTSASSAHAAGLVALMQGHRLDHGLPILSPAMVKAWLKHDAIDIEDVGFDFVSGSGLAFVPSWVLVDAPGGLLLNAPASPIVVGAANSLTGLGFTPGSRVQMFVATLTGIQSFGPYTPTNVTDSSLTFTPPGSVPLGKGFATVKVINTDQAFLGSATRPQLLYADPSTNVPTIKTVNGVALSPAVSSVPLAHVQTVIQQGATVTITGTAFAAGLKVNLFTGEGNFGPLDPLPGANSTSFQIVIPANTPTGPGSLQVLNPPFSPTTRSNAVSVPIGDTLSIDSITQNGSTITVHGTGFSVLSVINFFNNGGSGNQNFCGLGPSGPKCPLTLVSDEEFTFQKPAGSGPGRAYVKVLNPPYIPSSTTGNDPDGGFDLT